MNEVQERSKDEPGPRHRIWEIDFLRGLSIILMVFYHLGYDLNVFCGINRILGIEVNIFAPGFNIAQYFFAGVFIVLCGTSSTLSRSNVRRALKILAVAVVISVVTYVYSPSEAIFFGILHCLGVCILLYGLTLEKAGALTCAAVGIAILAVSGALSVALRGVTVPFNWLLPLGIHRVPYAALDYFPLLPWAGIYMAGVVLGKTVYAARKSLLPGRWPETFVNVVGRHALLIYVIHQPILLAALYLLGLMR
jgi:uncharacterized membrane protein